MNQEKISKVRDFARKSRTVVSNVLLSLYVLPYMARKYLDEHPSIVPKISEDSLVAFRTIAGSILGTGFTWGIHVAYNYGRFPELTEPTGLELLVHGGIGGIGNVVSGIYEICRNEIRRYELTKDKSAKKEEYANSLHRTNRKTPSISLDEQYQEIIDLQVTGPDRDYDGRIIK